MTFKWIGSIGICLLAAAPELAVAGSKNDTLIQIGVEVLEVNERKAQDLGIQWISSLHVSETDVPSFFKVGTLTRSALFADIQALMDEGAADLLANPKLVARAGSRATFHAGGELPYAVSAGLGTTSVEFKSYGVKLEIEPQITDQNMISLNIQAEVSSIDSQSGVTLGGNAVPGIRSRSVSSRLTLEPGSTLTLAGLLQSEKGWVRVGVPGLMHVPLLKYLFSRKTQLNRKTSIIVFLTPTLLNPPPAQALVAPPAPAPDHLMEALEEGDGIHG